jgi:hypothetical protein
MHFRFLVSAIGYQVRVFGFGRRSRDEHPPPVTWGCHLPPENDWLYPNPYPYP